MKKLRVEGSCGLASESLQHLQQKPPIAPPSPTGKTIAGGGGGKAPHYRRLSEKSVQQLHKMLSLEPHFLDHSIERRHRSQSAESVTSSASGVRDRQVYINGGIRLRMVPNHRRSPLHKSPLVSKILESMTAKCEEQFGASGSGQLSRSSR